MTIDTGTVDMRSSMRFRPAAAFPSCLALVCDQVSCSDPAVQAVLHWNRSGCRVATLQYLSCVNFKQINTLAACTSFWQPHHTGVLVALKVLHVSN